MRMYDGDFTVVFLSSQPLHNLDLWYIPLIFVAMDILAAVVLMANLTGFSKILAFLFRYIGCID